MLEWIREHPIKDRPSTSASKNKNRSIQATLQGFTRKVSCKDKENSNLNSLTYDRRSVEGEDHRENHPTRKSSIGQRSSEGKMAFESHLNGKPSKLIGSLSAGKKRKNEEQNRDAGISTEPTKRRKASTEKFHKLMSSENAECMPSDLLEDQTQPLAWDSDLDQSPKVMVPVQKRKIKPKRKAKAAFAPAISPSKKKSLIEQSAKDYAIRQARRNTPLSSIENQVDRKNGFLDPNAGISSIHNKDKTPSPLRKGFSLIQLGYETQSTSGIDDDVFDLEEEDDDGPASPLLDRLLSMEHRKNQDQSDKHSDKRIYALETQLNGQSVEMKGETKEFSSSQTAPGGSWPTQIGDTTVKPTNFYDGNAEETDDDWQLPESVHLLASKNDDFMFGSMIEDETQPLKWEMETSQESAGSASKPRYSEGWKDLSQVWQGHLEIPNSVVDEKKKDPVRQSTLGSFGFSRIVKQREEAFEESCMSDGENVASDEEGLEVDIYPTYHAKKPLEMEIDGDLGSSQGLALSVPSDTELDSDLREFFDKL